MRAAAAGNNSELIHWLLQEYGMKPTVDNVSFNCRINRCSFLACMHLQLVVQVYRIVVKNNTVCFNCALRHALLCLDFYLVWKNCIAYSICRR